MIPRAKYDIFVQHSNQAKYKISCPSVYNKYTSQKSGTEKHKCWAQYIQNGMHRIFVSYYD